jgi:hypothetical protein
MICSVELPTKYLKDFSKYFDFDFVIASTCLEHPEYFDYYKNKSRFMILDNGAFETGASINIEQYYEIAKELKPDILVLPDVFRNEVETMHLSFAFLRFWQENKIPGMELMGVLPGETPNRILVEHTFFKAAGVKWFGLPYGNMIDRFQFLKAHPELENIHILGLPALPEALSLKSLPNVVSIDSSLPVKCAVENKYLSKIIDSDSRAHPDKNDLDEFILEYNLRLFKEICNDNCIIVRK